VHKYLKGGCKEGRAELFLVMPNDRTRSSGHKLKQMRFPLNIRKHFFTVKVTEHWLVSESSFFEIFKSHLDMVLGSCL